MRDGTVGSRIERVKIGCLIGLLILLITGQAISTSKAAFGRDIADAPVKYWAAIDGKIFSISELQTRKWMFFDEKKDPITDLALARKLALVTYVANSRIFQPGFLKGNVESIDGVVKSFLKIKSLEVARDFLGRAFAGSIIIYGTAGAAAPRTLIGIPVRIIKDQIIDVESLLGSFGVALSSEAQKQYRLVIDKAPTFSPGQPVNYELAQELLEAFLAGYKLELPATHLVSDLSGLDKRWYDDLKVMAVKLVDEFASAFPKDEEIVQAKHLLSLVGKFEQLVKSTPAGQKFYENLGNQEKAVASIRSTIDFWASESYQIAQSWKTTLTTQPTSLPTSKDNLPPDPPTNLSQFRSDGVTEMDAGTTTNQNTVVLKGHISDPNNDTVKLQIELRGLGEYGGRFAGTPTLESPFFPSGSTTTITVYGLINASYHWRARTMNSKGATSQWLSAGNNPDSAADFIISVGVLQPIPPIECRDGVQFVGDTTVPDVTQMRPRQNFTKTWRVRNTGNCSWGSGYSLVFVSGVQMGAPSSVSVPSVSPSAVAEISLPMVAPTMSGVYQGNWQMRNSKGQHFGPQIWVNINVISVSLPPSPTQAQVPGPQIASISPTRVQAGQFTLTISGSDFDSGAVDQLYTPSGQYVGSGVQSGDLISRSSNQIVVRENLTNAQAGTYTISVKNSTGKISNALNIILVSPSLQPSATADCSQYLGKGYCTDYIRTKVNIPWKGDAITWLERAKENKFETGRIPSKSSIGVFSYAMPFGHVAYVEEVSSDQKKFTVSHWNFSGNWINKTCGVTDNFGKTTISQINTDNTNLLGFIYISKATVPPLAISPSVSMSPLSGTVGTTFTQRGRGFTPNSTATLHGRRSDGSSWQITTVNTDSSGAFSLTWTAQTPGNNFVWWAVDNATTKKSNEVVYSVVSAPPTSAPVPPPSPTPQIGRPEIVSNLRVLEIPPYKVGQIVTAEFSVRNSATSPITFDALTVGGRLNGQCPNNRCPDFEFKPNVTLLPNGIYTYRGRLKLEAPGNYHFFTAYRTKDGQWNTSIPTGSGIKNTLDIYLAPLPSTLTTPPTTSPQPPSTTVTSINSRIDVVDIIPKNVQTGGMVTLLLRLTNTGNVTHTFIAGASLWRPNDYSNPVANFERPVNLSPGQGTEVTWSYQPNIVGSWGYQFAVWKQKPFIQSNLLVKQPSPISFFSVTAAVTQPSPPLQKSPTPQAPPTPSPTVCIDGVQFVGDITGPDVTQMQPGQGFTKTWKLRNTGSCSWGSGYILAFVGGSQMGVQGSVPIPYTPNNGTADISVPMVAPSTSGIHQGYWQMRNSKGQNFGPQIWVKINVATKSVAPTPIPAPIPPTPNPPVASVFARIDGYSPGDPNNPVRVQIGGSATLSVKFTNTGNTAWRFIVGASVWDSKGRVVGDYSTPLSAPLQPGQQMGVSWNHPVREAGDYWVQFGVWKATPFVGENLIEKKPAPAQKLIVGIKK